MRQGVSLLKSGTASPLPPAWHEYEVWKVIDGLAGKRQAKQPPERRIVRRSRLLDALSASDARTILLIAPAGYGKTTLARQWLEEAGGVWVTVTEASGDIPVLAGDLVSALGIVSDIDARRVETAFSSGRAPTELARAVGRALLAQIPEQLETFIVLDDYHLLIGNRAAENLIATLERSGRFRILITSRERPSWATSRRRIYMETVELGADDLALDDREVAELLPPDQRTSSLRRKARGWPAALGLAAYATTGDEALTADALSATLYDYFAEELFDRAETSTQSYLTALSVLAPLTVRQFADFVGHGQAASQVVATGLAYEAGGRVEVHPLARGFLLEKLRYQPDADDVARAAFEFALEEGDYHQCLSLINELSLEDCLERLITVAYAPLANTGRINTLHQFGRAATANAGVPIRLTDLIAAETALVRSEFVQARSLGALSAEAFPSRHPLKARGLLISGQAAYFLYEFEAAFELHARASAEAVNIDDVNDAAWGRCLAAFALEDERMHAAVSELESLSSVRAADRVRLETARHQLAMFGGDAGIPIGVLAWSRLLAQVSSPWVRSGWSYTCATALMVGAHYDEAQTVLHAALAELDEVRFSFARPHGEWALAGVELGLRRFYWCDRRLRRIEHKPSYASDLHTQINVRALRARMLLAEQRAAEAVHMTIDDFPKCPTPAMYGEYLATRAVALAVVGEKVNALACAAQARSVTKSVYTKVLSACAQAIVSVGDLTGAATSAEFLLAMASTLKVWDPVVCSMRASAELAGQLALVPQYRTELTQVLLQARDAKIAKSVGLIARVPGSNGVLSPREREIMDQVKLGRKNAEIAASLHISPGTVKSHMDHIFDKLGVRSRTEAAARYAEIENADIDESDGSSASVPD